MNIAIGEMLTCGGKRHRRKPQCPDCGHCVDHHDERACWANAVKTKDGGPWFIESALPYWETFEPRCECPRRVRAMIEIATVPA